MRQQFATVPDRESGYLKHFIFKDLPVTKRVIKGVYMIGDVYIGATISLRSRVRSHGRALLNNTHTNKELQLLFNKNLKNGVKTEVKFLDPDPFKELSYKEKYGIISAKNEVNYHQHRKYCAKFQIQ